MTIGDSAFLRAPACCGRLPAVALLFCFAALTSLAAASDEIGSTPPPIYTRELAKQLTPLKTAVTFTSATLEDKAPALTLLEERIYRVDETGRRVVARQVVRKSRTDAGAHVNAEEIFIFRKHEQRFYLVLAEAIQPDGAVQPVKDSAILVQSPQRQAQYALYDDQAEVRVIFPNVKPGTVTHAIVVAEDIEPRMPGEFANTFSWSATWPIGEVRYVVDLPDALASRLQILTLGADVPAPTRENLRGARTRYTVVKEKISPVRDEYNPAPAEQFGPCLHLTTIADWDAVGRWYSGLLQGRDRLTPLLAVKVDAWASGAPTPEAVTQALFTKVADDVRYTGLEFGEADYRPHDCNEVWENQYGDCKDKANLLVAFLRHRGIEAFVTLVNAANAGVIDRRAPDFQAFTHAIVALPGPGGAYTFCDPTLAYARPGLLAPSDADREVLVITANGATWARTPPQSGGKFAYDFDLKMQPNGELVGWVSITGTEYYAATGQTWFRRLDTNEQRRAMSDLLRSFYPGAEVIDVVKPSEEAASHATYTVKAYFLVPRSLEAGAGRQNLVFPNPQSLFGPLGSNKERSTPLFLQRGVIAIRCVMRLPEGQTPELPAPFAVATPAGPVRAAWRFTAPDCRAEFEWETTESLVSATQFGDYYVAMDSLRSWLSKPVSLTSTGRAPPPAAATLVLDDFPRMPTGDGQLQLLQTRYPATGNLNLRKAALEATLQYFPDDKSTVFRVGVLLSELEWMVGHKAEAVSRLQLLLPAYRRELAPDVVAWGEVSLAWSLEHLDQADAAQLIYVRLAGNSELPQDLRAKAAVSAALLLKKKDPTGALAVLEPVAGWPTSAQAAAYAEIIYCLLATDRSADARSRLATLVETRPDAVVDLLAKIARATAGWTATSDGAAQEKLLSWIKELAPRGSPALDAALTDARTRRNSERVLGQIRDDLARQMAGPPLASWYTPAADAVLKSDEEFEQAENEAQQKNDLSRALQLSVQSALTLPPDANLPRRLWRAAVFLEAKEQADNRPLDDAVADAVLGASEKLPQDEAVFQTARLIHAEHHMLRGEYSAAAQLCREVLALPLSLERIRPLTGVLLGRCLEHVGDLEGALAVYINLEKYAASMPEAAGTQLRAVFLELQLGRSAEAAARVRLLAGLSETAWQKAEGAEQIRQLIILHRSGKAEEFWARRAKWWADWETFARELKLPAPGPDATIPVVLNPQRRVDPEVTTIKNRH